MPSLLTVVFCLLLICATVVGIVTTNDHAQRPSVGSFQNDSGLVLYGGR